MKISIFLFIMIIEMFNRNDCTILSAVSSFEYLQRFGHNFITPNGIHYEIYYTPIEESYIKYPEIDSDQMNDPQFRRAHYGSKYYIQPIIDNHDNFFNYDGGDALNEDSITHPISLQYSTNDLDTKVLKNTSKHFIEDLLLPNTTEPMDISNYNRLRNERNVFKKMFGHVDFGYDRNNEVLDPSGWHLIYPDCGARLQSPININDNIVIPFPYHVHGPINFGNYFLMPNSVMLENTGHSVELKFNYADPTTRPFVEGGGLKYRYVLDQLHFHWGDTNQRGSEHAVNSRYYAAEIHAVHIRSDYAELKEAMKDRQGLLVIAYMLELDDQFFDRTFEFITNFLDRIVTPKSSIEIETFPPSFLIKTNFDNHNIVTYAGSLTTPPCAESVTWIIAPETLRISSKQLNKFRQLESDHGIMSKNNRPIQPANRRKVFVISSVDTQNQS